MFSNIIYILNIYIFSLVADNGKCLIGSSVLYDMRKSTVDSISDEACNKLLLDLELKSCVDANTMDNVIQFNSNYAEMWKLTTLKITYFMF